MKKKEAMITIIKSLSHCELVPPVHSGFLQLKVIILYESTMDIAILENSCFIGIPPFDHEGGDVTYS